MYPPDSREVLHESPIVMPHIGLEGMLVLPPRPSGLVLLAHGSASSRLSPRNRSVAGALHASGLGSPLFDLLTHPEADDGWNVCDTPLFGTRLVEAIDDVISCTAAKALPIGLFGMSTGAAAALAAAARRLAVRAVVSRGGRPDLGPEAVLARVAAPTPLIVGGEDRAVLAFNRLARARMAAPRKLLVVPGAPHLLEEPGALAEVARADRETARVAG